MVKEKFVQHAVKKVPAGSSIFISHKGRKEDAKTQRISATLQHR